MFERMIVADDGSELARASIAPAAAIALAGGSEVLVLRVSRTEGDDSKELGDADWHAHLRGPAAARDRAEPIEAEPYLSSFVDELRGLGVGEVGSLVVEGSNAADALVEAADHLGADLLVMTTSGLGGVRRAVLGSVASDVVRRAERVPVLLCRPSSAVHGARIERVLLPLDGSDLAARALPHAEQLAHMTGAELVLMRVIEAPDARTTARDDLTALAAALRAGGLAGVAVDVAEGDAGGAIVDAVARLRADIVVMATHGRGGLGRALLGSVADSVSRHLEDAALLLVHPHGER